MIRFFCPGCGQLVQTSDRTAGKKGQCPHCQIKVQIPTTTLVLQTPDKPSPTVTVPKKPDVISLVCGRCKGQLQVPYAYAGKKGRCVHCGAVMAIPEISGQKPPPVPGQARHKSRTNGSLEFQCGVCGGAVKVRSSAQGKKGKCPHCAAIVEIPRT